jgi:hypothetical protein
MSTLDRHGQPSPTTTTEKSIFFENCRLPWTMILREEESLNPEEEALYQRFVNHEKVEFLAGNS